MNILEDLTTSGLVGLGGEIYDHGILTVGRNNNPLDQYSQVSIIAQMKGNANATVHIAGVETKLSTEASEFTVADMNNFVMTGIEKGEGSIITRTRFLGFLDENAGDNNAVMAAHNHQFTGDWFINYQGSRPSRFGGDFAAGMDPVAVANARQIFISGEQYAFLRMYIGGVEKGRITVDAAGVHVANIANGPLDLKANGNVGLTVNADGTVTIPSLVGTGSRTVKADAAGKLSAV